MTARLISDVDLRSMAHFKGSATSKTGMQQRIDGLCCHTCFM